MTTKSMMKTAAAVLAITLATFGSAAFAQSSTTTNTDKPASEGVVAKTKKVTKKAVAGTKKVAHKAGDATKRGANKAAGAVRNTGEKIGEKLPAAPAGANSNLNATGQPKSAP